MEKGYDEVVGSSAWWDREGCGLRHLLQQSVSKISEEIFFLFILFLLLFSNFGFFLSIELALLSLSL